MNSNFLSLIETADIRVYKIRGTDPRADLYRDVIAQIKNGVGEDTLYMNLQNFCKRFMDDNSFRTYLNGGLYKNPAVKYILWEYEGHNNPNFNDCDHDLYESLQVEHIFPQTPSFEIKNYNFTDSSDYVANIHRIGNLTLLRPDSSNDPPNVKANKYQQADLLITKQLGAHIANQGFDKNSIEERTQQIIHFCVKRWQI